MHWESVTALATALTALVILVSAVYAARQVKVAARATQLDAMLRILERYRDPQFLLASNVVLHELPGKIRDPAFRSDVAQGALAADRPWHVVLRLLNETGVYVELGLLEGPPIYYLMGDMLVLLWEALAPVIDIERRALDDPHRWTNTQELCKDAAKRVRAYYRRNPKPRPSSGEPFTFESLISRVRGG
jgi:hypothetical protein